MNWWYPVGIGISLYVIYASFNDDRLIQQDSDEFLRRQLAGEGDGFYLTLNSRLGRVTRAVMPKLADIKDDDERRRYLEKQVLNMPGREKLMKMVLWEVRFRMAIFTVIGLILLLDLLTG